MESIPSMNGSTTSHADRMLQVLGFVHYINICSLALVKFKVKPSQNHSKSDGSFKCGEFITDAPSCSSTKRQIGKVCCRLVRIEPSFPFVWVESLPFGYIRIYIMPCESQGIKFPWFWPEPFIVMNIVQCDEHIHTTNQ